MKVLVMHQFYKVAPLIGALWSTCLLPADAVELNTQVHAFGGLVAVEQEKESLSNLVLGLWGTVTITSDGKASGSGIIRYEGVAPCAWTPPAPENGPAPYCELKNLQDGAFTVTGEISGEMQTQHLLTGLSDMVTGESKKTAQDIIDTTPSTLKLQMTMTDAPKELIEFWGLSDGEREMHETGVATGGLHVSTLFDKPFFLSPVPNKAGERDRYEFSGIYPGDWPIKSAGAVYFPDLPPSKLPKETAYEVFINGGVTPNGSKLGEDTLNLDVLNPWFGGAYNKY